MALVVKDRVQETTTTTGTGTVTLAGAVTGFQSFSVIGDGNTTYYAITSGNDWEVGVGTYTSSGTTLSRDTILESSNAGSAITLSGTSNVFVTYPAERSVNTEDIGVSVQAYDADTLKADVADTLTAPFRGTVTTDNDLSFDQDVTNNFSCTPSSGGTLTFTNHTAGQSGYVLLDNSGGYAITAAATTKIHTDDLTTISTAGVYLLSYFDNGTNAYITISKSFS
jgi:hypothetical protein